MSDSTAAAAIALVAAARRDNNCASASVWGSDTACKVPTRGFDRRGKRVEAFADEMDWFATHDVAVLELQADSPRREGAAGAIDSTVIVLIVVRTRRAQSAW